MRSEYSRKYAIKDMTIDALSPCVGRQVLNTHMIRDGNKVGSDTSVTIAVLTGEVFNKALGYSVWSRQYQTALCAIDDTHNT